MASDDVRRVVLSADCREMTILTPTPAGAHRTVLGRGPHQEPFNAEDVRLAMEMAVPTLTESGQRNTARRWVTPLGDIYGHLMLGPPTWWLPKIELRRDGVMVGWLRVAAAVGFRREEGRTNGA